ncbi:MAG: hypothetical protein ACR2QF_02560 [Geminicoccaceae bacterium]
MNSKKIFEKITKVLLHPEPYRVRFFRPLLKSIRNLDFKTRILFDLMQRPHYGYCLWHASRLAKRLHVPEIVVIEMGVAGGRGLLCLERYALAIESELGVAIKVIGFDMGEGGLPEPRDYRDCPQVWRSGFYKMDEKKLRERISPNTELFIGDVSKTVDTFASDGPPGPIGAILFDMDFHSSTMDSFQIFDLPCLPRVMCYFDDIVHGDPIAGVNEFVGQAAAIDDYNDRSVSRKFARDRSLLAPRKLPAQWNQQVYIHHDFDHHRYGDFVGTVDDQRWLP